MVYDTEQIAAALRDAVNAEDRQDSVMISTGLYFDGTSMPIAMEAGAQKTIRLSSTPAFLEWLAYSTADVSRHRALIDRLAARHGVHWDGKCLSLTFRRNELPLGEAVLRLTQAMSVIGTVGELVT